MSAPLLNVHRLNDPHDFRTYAAGNVPVAKKRMLSPTLSSISSSSSSSFRATQLKGSTSASTEIATVPLGLSPILESAMNQRNGSQRKSDDLGESTPKKPKVGTCKADEIEHISDDSPISVSAKVSSQKETIASDFSFNGGVYSGLILWGLPHGEGKWVDSNGFTYFCRFNFGIMEGKGKVIRPNESILFQGELKQNKPNGKGHYFLKNGNIFIGNFVNGFFEGPGKIITFDGDYVYEGGFTSGSYHGQGLLTENGYAYTGNFVRGHRHGYSEVKEPDRKLMFQGDFLNDKIHDKGNDVISGWEHF